MIHWFFSKTVREARAMRRHVMRLVNAQRDLLSADAIRAIIAKIAELDAAIGEGARGKIRIKTEELQFTTEKWIKPYPNPLWRENVEVLLVALAVAMGIRTFFLQPFKIPTASMQPTLYGVTSVPDYDKVINAIGAFDRLNGTISADEIAWCRAKIKSDMAEQQALEKNLVIPTGWKRVKQWFEGISYLHVVAQHDGALERIDPPVKFLIFNIKQTLWIGGMPQTIWFPPDYGESSLQNRAGLVTSQVYHKGQDVVNMVVHSGDHLFVDRLTYNFRPPKRGEIVVFETKGIPGEERARWQIPGNEFFIKRLVGLGGETLAIHQNYTVTNLPVPVLLETPIGRESVAVGNLVANGKPVSADTPHFENLYSFSNPPAGAKFLDYHDNHYYGHAMLQGLSPGQQYHVQPGHVFVMGDNTMNSLDSRFWGDFPRTSLIGKAFFVYWPISPRFGLDDH